MNKASRIVALDVGEKRIGVAVGDSDIKIAVARPAIDVDGSEILQIHKLVDDESASIVVIGFPRNQSGEPTQQTEIVQAFVGKLKDLSAKIVFKDESLTSVIAEDRLKQIGKPYTKADIDSMAASIILQDYLEENYGR